MMTELCDATQWEVGGVTSSCACPHIVHVAVVLPKASLIQLMTATVNFYC